VSGDAASTYGMNREKVGREGRPKSAARERQLLQADTGRRGSIFSRISLRLAEYQKGGERNLRGLYYLSREVEEGPRFTEGTIRQLRRRLLFGKVCSERFHKEIPAQRLSSRTA